MKAREKLLITISVLACGVSIAVFALVSLGHFIYTPDRATIPVVGKMYENTVQQVALLETVPVPQAPTPVTTNSTPAPVQSDETEQPEDNSNLSKQSSQVSKHHKYSKKSQSDYTYLRQSLAALFGLL